MLAEPLRSLAVPVTRLTLLEGNPRRGDVAAVARSLKRFGQRKPIVAKADGTVVAGNHTLAAARELGWTEIAVVWVDDDDATAKAYALADNRTSALGSFDEADLAAMVGELYAADPELLAAASFSADDVAALLNNDLAGTAGLTDPDDTPEVPVEPVTQPGDLWLLGPHRLYCGNATNADDLARLVGAVTPDLVYTDPPYGISIVKTDGKIGSGGKFRGKIGDGKIVSTTVYMKVAGDDTTDTARDSVALLLATYPQAVHVWWGGNHYAASAGLPDSSCWLVWDKDNGTNDFADAELAWTNHKGAVRLLRHTWNGMVRATERGKRVHPTQKPVALAEWAFGVVDKQSTATVVLDPFAGSGSTLIAAHRSGRTALCMELEPLYVDVIARRYQEHTGTVPIREATGEPYDFVATA